MKMHSAWLAIFLTCMVSVLCLPSVVFAVPDVYVDDVGGNDANDGHTWNGAVTSTGGTYRRAIELGVLLPEIGLRTRNLITPPDPNFIRSVNAKKNDRTVETDTAPVIAGHEAMPKERRERSSKGGWYIRTVYNWLVYTAPNGEQAEYLDSVTETTEEY